VVGEQKVNEYKYLPSIMNYFALLAFLAFAMQTTRSIEKCKAASA
jgi:hypothetical protein